MPADLEFTGERFVPGVPGMIAYEHGHRYAFALRHARGRRVLDAACGEGYGTAALARVAQSAIGVDVSPEAVMHADEAYGHAPNVRFVASSVTALPFAANRFDLVVSFETIEHVGPADQSRMLAEFARVLAPDGLLVLSSPNRRRYTEERDYHNPFHLHELDRNELSQLLERFFPAWHWYHQLAVVASALWSEAPGTECESWTGAGPDLRCGDTPDGLYYVVLAAKAGDALPASEPRLSLYSDQDQTELRRAEAAHAEVIRLDALLRERTSALDAQTAHIRHLEQLVAFRERIIVERDDQLAQCNRQRASDEEVLAAARASFENGRHELAQMREELARLQKMHASTLQQLAQVEREGARLERALAAQERIIQYRHSWQWWLQLPWMHARAWWQRVPRI